MGNIKYYLYNTTFWISRFITLSVFGTCFFAILNAKYIWSETFFSKLLKCSFNLSLIIHKIFDLSTNPVLLLKLSFFAGPNVDTKYDIFGFKYAVYKLFCSNSQNIDILIYAFISIILIYCGIKYTLNNKKRYYIFTLIFLEIFSIYFGIYLYTNNLNFLYLSIFSPIFFVLLYLINLYCPVQKIVVLLPMIGEMFCINNIVTFITKKKNIQSEIFILIVCIIVSSIIYMFLPNLNNNFNNLVIKNNNVYNISVDNKQDRFIISSHPILLVDSANNKGQQIKVNDSLYQDISVNWDKEEIYIYSVTEGVLSVVDINSKREKAKIEILNDNDSKKCVRARLVYDSESNLLLIIFESDFGAFLINLEKLQIISKYEIVSPNDSGVYNKFRNSFIVTYFQVFNMIQEIDIDNNSVNDIIIGSEHGYITSSKQNKELYIAFHQQGKIGVYDAKTMELKRKIKSNYTVKDITYDEELNVLIAPSYFTGYIDIFLMDGSDDLLIRKFVGYDLREARFDTKKENLYVCSKNGLYKVPLNIKELIKKHKMFHMKH